MSSSFVRSRSTPRRARHGSIQRLVLEVMELSAVPLSPAAVHAEVELELDGTVSMSSVKNALARLTQGIDAPIARIDTGLYFRRSG